jgi:hypothetical protein
MTSIASGSCECRAVASAAVAGRSGRPGVRSSATVSCRRGASAVCTRARSSARKVGCTRRRRGPARRARPACPPRAAGADRAARSASTRLSPARHRGAGTGPGPSGRPVRRLHRTRSASVAVELIAGRYELVRPLCLGRAATTQPDTGTEGLLSPHTRSARPRHAAGRTHGQAGPEVWPYGLRTAGARRWRERAPQRR